MALEDIEKEIIAAAEREASRIVKEAKAASEKLFQEAEARAAAFQKESLEKAEAQAVQIKERAKISAELAQKNKLLGAKQKIIQEVFQKTIEKLKNLSRADYQALLGRSLKNFDNLPGVVLPARGREKETEEVLAKLALKNLKSGEGALAGAGGFLIKSKNFDIDGSFEAALEKLKTKIEAEILKMLFGLTYEK